MRTNLSQEALLWAQIVCAITAPTTLTLAYMSAQGYHKYDSLLLKIMFIASGTSHVLAVVASAWAFGVPWPVALLLLSALALRSSVNDTLTSSWLPLAIAVVIGVSLLYLALANLGVPQLTGLPAP